MDKDCKATNPKDAIGSDKLPVNLWPQTATAFGCIGLLNGMLKYGRTNWRACGVRASIYIDACMRHLIDWADGEDHDPEDGVHNLSAALACLAIIVDAMCSDKLNDDRNYHTGAWRKARAMMEPHVKHLKSIHAERDPKHYTIQDSDSEGLLVNCEAAPPLALSEELADRIYSGPVPAEAKRRASEKYLDK